MRSLGWAITQMTVVLMRKDIWTQRQSRREDDVKRHREMMASVSQEESWADPSFLARRRS